MFIDGDWFFFQNWHWNPRIGHAIAAWENVTNNYATDSENCAARLKNSQQIARVAQGFSEVHL